MAPPQPGSNGRAGAAKGCSRARWSVEVGPLTDFSQLVELEDAAGSIDGTSEISIKRWSRRAARRSTVRAGRARRAPAQALEQRCDLEFRVRARARGRRRFWTWTKTRSPLCSDGGLPRRRLSRRCPIERPSFDTRAEAEAFCREREAEGARRLLDAVLRRVGGWTAVRTNLPRQEDQTGTSVAGEKPKPPTPDDPTHPAATRRSLGGGARLKAFQRPRRLTETTRTYVQHG